MSHLNSNINETYILEPVFLTGETVYSACTGFFTDNILSCNSIASIYLGDIYVELNVSLIPEIDNTIDIGLPNKRFRAINTISGNTTYWTSENTTINSLTATTINLGLDTENNQRILNADSVVLANDTLTSGFY